LWSSHWWSEERDPYVLLIGLYPEVPIKRLTAAERRYAERHGCVGVIKVNVCDLRADSLDEISAAGIAACTPLNRRTICDLCLDAKLVVLCWDTVPEVMSGFVDRVLGDLQAAGITVIGMDSLSLTSTDYGTAVA
jgi:hypothetical protein